MHLISWNLNHRTLEKPIPEAALDFFESYRPDLIALNEFVDGSSRMSFRARLADLGYGHQLVSATQGKHNQIFVASRHVIEIGDLAAPPLDEVSRSNYLHVRIPSASMEVVAFRAPAYAKKAQRDIYWSQLRAIMTIAHDRPICFIGDANFDPFVGPSSNSASVLFDAGGRYTIPRPSGDWSYISIDGVRHTRIDHAFLTESLRHIGVEYIVRHNDLLLAGAATDKPVTDHAVLSIHLHRK